MPENIYQVISDVFGIGVEPAQMLFLQITFRAIVAFVAALAMVRTADNRITERSLLNLLLILVLGLVLAHAISGSPRFLPPLAVCFAIVLLHKVLAPFIYHYARHD